MARYAFISDIHSNVQALESVLTEIGRAGVDGIICLGDVVGYGARPVECLELVREHCDLTIIGNHDEFMIENDMDPLLNDTARESLMWTMDKLGEAHLDYIRSLSGMVYLSRDLMCVHDNPVPSMTGYIRNPRAASNAFLGVDRSICMVGHTHVPQLFHTATSSTDAAAIPLDVQSHYLEDGYTISLNPEFRYIINPGAVGQPRDADPRASWGILDLTLGHFQVNRAEYDVAGSRQDVLDAGLPGVLADRLVLGT